MSERQEMPGPYGDREPQGRERFSDLVNAVPGLGTALRTDPWIGPTLDIAAQFLDVARDVLAAQAGGPTATVIVERMRVRFAQVEAEFSRERLQHQAEAERRLLAAPPVAPHFRDVTGGAR